MKVQIKRRRIESLVKKIETQVMTSSFWKSYLFVIFIFIFIFCLLMPKYATRTMMVIYPLLGAIDQIGRRSQWRFQRRSNDIEVF